MLFPMRQQIYLGALYGVLLLPAFAQAQDASATASRNTSDPVSASALSTRQQAMPAAKTTSGSDNDRRLYTPVTLKRANVRLDEALAMLNGFSTLKLRTLDQEIAGQRIAATCKDAPMRNVLDSLARLNRWEWVRKDRDTLLLRSRYDPTYYDAGRPHTPEESEVSRIGKQFAAQFSQLSPEMQQAMSRDAHSREGNNSLPYSSLPASMQNTLQSLLSAENQRMASTSHSPYINGDDLGSCSIRLEITSTDGVTRYNVKFDKPQTGSQAAAFSVFHAPRDQGERIVPVEALTPNVYNPMREDADARLSLLATDARLNLPVTLQLDKATFAEALTALAKEAHINIVARDSSSPAKILLHFAAIPLKDVLERYVQAYRPLRANTFLYSWTESKGGVFVFHIVPAPIEQNKTVTNSASNPAAQ